ncbi:MAG TPA: transglycosylase SLT domain-containing protein [Gemmatimonadaceae bacterium]|nr:transglycosylase SLT domain-containing protein [Gemmatimonadaceae bacterium]
MRLVRSRRTRILTLATTSLLAAFLSFAACGRSSEADAAGDVSESSDRALAQAIASSGPLTAAQALIDSGHPWRATQLLAPVLRDSATRTPAALIVAARAAAGWSGWAEVDKLLGRAGWLDAQFDGEGRELLARSALERGADTIALTQASAAAADARDATTRGPRLVFLARALERNNQFDSAAATYLRAAADLRDVRDWLALRAAGNEQDSAKRAAAFADVKLAAARPRVAWTEAQARERFADPVGAATRYAALGATVPALRLRLSVANDSAARDSIRVALLAFVRSHSGSSDAKQAVEVLDKGFTALTAGEELIVARSAAASGPQPRALTAFAHALALPSSVTASDRIDYAQVLARAGRTKDAIAQLDAVTGPLAAQAAYQRARILLNAGTAEATRTALRDVAARFPADTSVASSALYLLADLTTDDGNDAAARTLFRQVYAAYPRSARAVDARFRAAIIAFVAGDAKSAAHELDSLSALYPRSDESTAAQYWAGRAWAAAGNKKLATTRWRAIVAQPVVSYYTVQSLERLGAPTWKPAARPDSFPRVPAVDSAATRIALLTRLGMDVEARLELDALDDQAASSIGRTLATAHAFLALEQPSRAMRLGQKLIDAGERDGRAFRLAFPAPDRDELSRDARARGLDPALVAGLIRQESSFNPRAVSVAGARGLMQVLPPIGEDVAKSLAFPVWYPALLTDADANLQIGTAHLATYTQQYGALPRVLAAYNAGGSRVTRWATKAGMDDPELFAERIPFTETRDYVRIVQRNAAIYSALYKWK